MQHILFTVETVINNACKKKTAESMQHVTSVLHFDSLHEIPPDGVLGFEAETLDISDGVISRQGCEIDACCSL